MPWWLALTIGLPVLGAAGIAWVVTMSYQLVVRLNQLRLLRKAEQRRMGTRQTLETRLRAKAQEIVDGTAPGPQRDETRYWLDLAIPAYLRYLYEGRWEQDLRDFQRAVQEVDDLKRIDLGICPFCKAAGQLVGRQCSYCGQARVAFVVRRD